MRNSLAAEIREKAVAWSVAFAEVEEIDRLVSWPCAGRSRECL
jgi:ribonuclease HII